MRRVASCLPVMILAAACASGGASSGANVEPEAVVVQNTQNIIQTGGQNSMSIGSGMTTVVQASTTRVNIAADKLFGVLPATYESIGIPVSTMVSKDRMLGNLEFKARARIGSLQMRRLLDCGTQLGEPNSDSYQITMSVSSEVKDNGDGSSTLATLVQATGRPVQFNGADVRCTSFGELEKRIATTAQIKLAESR